LKRDRSEALFERALHLMSGGVNSPVRAFKAVGGTPIYIEHGEGAYIYDVDGNRYLDFCCSWGPLILGHAHPVVLEAISRTAAKGTSFGTVHENEILLAEKIKELCPHLELLRFVSSGTEAVMSALRLARAFTQRDNIVKFSGCYHGHSDYLLASAGSGLATLGIPASKGVPADFARHTLVVPLDDKEAMKQIFDKYGSEIAAVIIEPIPANNGLLLQTREYLNFLRDITKEHGALLIFDEVISGFRVAPGGAAELYEITPDLATYGKVVGGGLPVGAFGGRADIMSLLAPLGPVYQAGTLSGNPLALACGLATLDYLQANNSWNTLSKKSSDFVGKIKELLKGAPVNITAIASIFWINLQPEQARKAEDIRSENSSRYAELFNRALNEGIYLAPSAYEVGFVNTEHQASDLDRAAGKLSEIIRSLK
jgi:glutamate-1-semialdehyde 2,1-aminomutase